MALLSRSRSSTPRLPWTLSTSTKTTPRRPATTRCGRRWALPTPTTSLRAMATEQSSPSVLPRVRASPATSTIASRTPARHPQCLYLVARPRPCLTHPKAMAPSFRIDLRLDRRQPRPARRTSCPLELLHQRLFRNVPARRMTCPRLSTPPLRSQTAAMPRPQRLARAQIPLAGPLRDTSLRIAARQLSRLLNNISNSRHRQWQPFNIP
jgi:hypothetical protein